MQNMYWVSLHTLREYIPCSFAYVVSGQKARKKQKVQMN